MMLSQRFNWDPPDLAAHDCLSGLGLHCHLVPLCPSLMLCRDPLPCPATEHPAPRQCSDLP